MTAAVQDLSYDRSIPRGIVHRESIAEVFLTDAHSTPNGAVFAAQLPRNHSYFSDHRGTAATYDPLLLVEVFRQVAIYYAHKFVGVDSTQKFIFGSADFEVLDPTILKIAQCPGHCRITAEAASEKRRGDTIIGLTLEMTAYIEGNIVAREAMAYQWMPAEVWSRIRSRGREALGLSAEYGTPSTVPLARMRPGSVGRHNPNNAILANPCVDHDGEISALTVVDTNHPSLFDHALDHVPGMLQFEAARQIAMAAANAALGLDTNRMIMHSFEVAFEKFGEFEIDSIARATAVQDPQDKSSVFATVRITQGEESIAAGRVHLRVIPIDVWTMVQ